MKNPTSRQTIEAYNRNAGNYADKFDNYEVYQKKITDFQRKCIPKGAHILDLGCGPGNNIKTILEQDSTCTFDGIDLSNEFIKLAKQRFPQFRFLQQDICDLSLENTYKVVIASFCIVHLTDKEAVDFIHSLSGIIETGGYLYLSYMNGEKSGFETTSFSRDEIFFNYYQDKFITDLLNKNRMKVLEISKEEYIEPDGSTTIDTFIYGQKQRPL